MPADENKPVDERVLDHGNVIETPHGTFVVTGVQRVEDFEGNVVRFNYMITEPKYLIEEAEEKPAPEE